MNVSGGLIIGATLLILGSGVYWIRREMNDLAEAVAPIVQWFHQPQPVEPPTEPLDLTEPIGDVLEAEVRRPVPQPRTGRHRK